MGQNKRVIQYHTIRRLYQRAKIPWQQFIKKGVNITVLRGNSEFGFTPEQESKAQ
jgi:vacuolar-type H+-ATPase catalytic subunit A/Vma1